MADCINGVKTMTGRTGEVSSLAHTYRTGAVGASVMSCRDAMRGLELFPELAGELQVYRCNGFCGQHLWLREFWRRLFY